MATAEEPTAGRLGPRLWLVPSAVVAVVMAVLAAMYLGGTVNSSDNLHRFPVAIVNADKGATTATGRRVDTGAQITEGLRKNVDSQKFDLRVLSLAEARKEMGEAKLYGAIVLPSDLSAKLGALTAGSVSGGTVDRPDVTVYTNQLANSSSGAIVNAFATQALTSANQTVGKQLVAQATAAAAGVKAGDAKVSGTARLVLSEPMDVRVMPFQRIPDGTGNGLSAFYYALLLVLAGFTGSLIVSNLVDVELGFLPSEMGPIYRLQDHSGRSRLATLALKWALMSGIAVVISTAYLGIADWLGMPLDHPWQLWLFGVLVICAVSVVVQTILALFGGLGMVINFFLFIVLSIPSSGGTAPLEATPPVFRILGAFEPMRQVYLGTRSILYFGARWDAGLGRAVIACVVALAAGLAVGVLGTLFYDRKGFRRHYAPLAVAEA
ncbi:YhgE/Pip domain-containing protein [Streptomyces sp. NPDC091217]|uniref:YhgE/Pip domain-containing protein n=1 Tax=Streptomyces sp. NPDC091217 TaxID=3365975 RepID=UPI003808A007